MSKLPEEIFTPTTDAIYKQYEEDTGDWRRDHLGSSLIGKECERALWMDFRWATDPDFSGRMLRLFKSGFIAEERFVKDLRSIGVRIYDRDPETGNQIYYSEFGGHFAGSLDGIADNFIEAPKTFHVCEFKSSNTKEFNKLMKTRSVKESKPLHYAQMQTYMRWAKLDRAMYLVVCKEDDRIYEERVYYDKDFANMLKDKAFRIITYDNPPHGISDDPEYFQCRFCNHTKVCFKESLPEVNCRTCAYADPDTETGRWICTKDNHELSPLDQRKAGDCHIFIPEFINLEQVDADPIAGTITYEGDITNGPGATLSKDLGNKIQW